jgi:hypothetical protein
MSAICPHCGKEFLNTRALGSHIYYRHKGNRAGLGTAIAGRSADEKKKFRALLEKCLLGTGLRLPRDTKKIELALAEVPPGISSVLDQYRDAFSRALGKEKLLKEVEELLRQEEKGTGK